MQHFGKPAVHSTLLWQLVRLLLQLQLQLRPQRSFDCSPSQTRRHLGLMQCSRTLAGFAV